MLGKLARKPRAAKAAATVRAVRRLGQLDTPQSVPPKRPHETQLHHHPEAQGQPFAHRSEPKNSKLN
jgi:hypothetical protein